MAHPGFGHEPTILLTAPTWTWQHWTEGLRTGPYLDLG
jgi:hypothetical protein